MKLDYTLAEMGQIGKELRRRFRQSLSQKRPGKRAQGGGYSSNSNASGALSKSIRYENKLSSGEITLDFEMLKYGLYVNKGVRGAKNSPFSGQRKSPYKYSGSKKMVPPGSIRSWAARKGLGNFRDKKGRFVSRESVVIAIAVSIYNRGLKPTYFLDKPMTKMEKEIERRLGTAYEKDVVAFLQGGK